MSQAAPHSTPSRRFASAPLVLALVLCAASAFAQTPPRLTVVVVDAPGLGDPLVKRAQRATVEVLKQSSAWQPVEGPEWRRAAPKRVCAENDAACLRELARSASSPYVLFVWLRPSDAGLSAVLVTWLDGARGAGKAGEVPLESMEWGFKPVVEAVLPLWARRGFGGIAWPSDAAVTLRIDGRAQVKPKSAVLGLSAGPHQVDQLYADGRAVMQRVDVKEGLALALETPTPLSATRAFTPRNDALRGVSYGLWVSGAAALAASFVVAFVGRQTAVGANPCRPDSRECLTYEQAAERERAAKGYALPANVLLGTGIGLMLAGSGLFVIDVLR